MKLIHISDLHLGKRVNGFSMLEDQNYILQQILQIVRQEQPDGVLIAGDVYDKSVPSAEAVALLDDFLVRLTECPTRVFLISGNHDSPERLAFGGRLMERSGVYLAPVYDGKVEPVRLTDDYGEARIYLLPFLRPVHVRRFFPEKELDSYTDALRVVVREMCVDAGVRNVLVTHQFVTGAARCDSEDISVGGTDNVDASVFDPFDYVALGHIHSPQTVGRETMRYSGTPLPYSFSEAGQQKSVAVAELAEKGSVAVRTVPLKPLRGMTELRGTYDALTYRGFYDGTSYPTDYVHITLTDEEDVPDAMSRLRTIYQNLMKLDYDNTRTRAGGTVEGAADVERKTPLELLEEFYELQNGQPVSEAQRSFVRELMEQIWEGEK